MSAALLWLAGALVVGLIVVSLLPCLRFLPRLLSAGEPGFTWDYDRRLRVLVVTEVEPGGPAAAAGLRTGDRIIRILGHEPSPALDLWGPPGKWVLQPGDTLEVVVRRGGRQQALRWELASRPWYRVTLAAPGWRLGFDQAFHASFLLSALATLGLGAWVLRHKPHLLAARAFAGLCWALALAQFTAVVAHVPPETVPSWLYHLVFANDGWARMALAAGVFFFLVFPEPKRLMRRHPWALGTATFTPALLLLAAHGALAHSMWRFQFLEGQPDRARAVERLVAVDWWGYTCPTLLLLLGLLAHSYHTTRSGPARRQLAVFGLAAVPLILFLFASTLLLIVRGGVPLGLSLVSPILFLAWPVALGYAILTQGAFDIGRAVRRGMAYALSTVTVAAFCFAVSALIGQEVIERLGIGYTGLVIAGVSMLAYPIWGGVQRWVDRQFGRDRLAALGQLELLSSEIATLLDLEPLAETLTERVSSVLGASRAVLFSRASSDEPFAVQRTVGLNAQDTTLPALARALTPVFAAGEPAALYVPREDAARWGLTAVEVEQIEETGLVLWVPLSRRGKTELLLALGWKRGEDVYTREEIALLRVVGSQAAAAWENAHLMREREARARVEQEIEIGRTIQMRLLPPSPLFFGSFRIDARCVPATEVGGDFYNVFPLSAPVVGLIVGDVSGKGVPGALYMAVVSSLIEGLSQSATADVEPAELLARANARVYPKLRPLRMFVTAACAVLDVEQGRLLLANAGQTPPILWRAGDEPQFVRLVGLPLGARAEARYEQHALSLQPGDLCIFTSDGLLDQSSPQGYAELRRRLCPAERSAPEALLDALYTLSPGSEPDDRTAVILSRGTWPRSSDE